MTTIPSTEAVQFCACTDQKLAQLCTDQKLAQLVEKNSTSALAMLAAFCISGGLFNSYTEQLFRLPCYSLE